MGSNLGIEPADLFRLVQMACDIAADRRCSVSEAIDQIGLASARTVRPLSLLEFVRTVKRHRLRRNSSFDTSLFRDPAWDMLLDLFIADEEAKPLSVSALCLGSGVAMTTALRHVQRLVDDGFIARQDDVLDQRRSFLVLSPSRKAAVTRFLGDWQRDSMAAGSEERSGAFRLAREQREPTMASGSATGHPVFLS
jgi:DNA-binding MarR family transcriptional regulator